MRDQRTDGLTLSAFSENARNKTDDERVVDDASSSNLADRPLVK